MRTSKSCNVCAVDKPLAEFAKDHRQRDGKHGICKPCHNEKNKQYRLKLTIAGLCRCGNPITNTKRPKCSRCNRYDKRWRQNNLGRYREKQRLERIASKDAVLAHFGHRCMCPGGCSIAEADFLTIDHIHGGGNKHRIEGRTGGGSALYKWLIKNQFPEGFRLLCYNCNCARNSRMKNCPHERQPTPASALVDSV